MENNTSYAFFEGFSHVTSVMLVGTVTFLSWTIGSKAYQGWQKKRRQEKMLEKFQGPPGHWLTGVGKDMTLDQAMLDKMVDWIKMYGPDIRMSFFGLDELLLSDPDSFAAVMKTSGPKDKFTYSFMEPWIGKGILTSEGPHWFRNRRLLTPAFHFEVLKTYADVMQQSAKILTGKWKAICDDKEATFEMFQNFSLMTLDSLLKTAFSTDINCQNSGTQHPYISAVNQISSASMERMVSFLKQNDFIFYNLTSQGHATKRALKVAKDFTKDIIRRRREERKGKEINNQRKYRDFVDMLLDAKDKDGCGLTDKEILDEVDTFMFAGHDTTASGLSWFMYNMARHPEYQDRCRDEINEVFSDKDYITWSDLSKLEYLTMCIKESLRLHGPVVSIARTAPHDIQLPDGRIIPEDTTVELFLYGVHHSPAVWENPEEYDPDRFAPENSQGRHSHAFVPFSAGPRNCIGQHFAMMELKIVAAQVLRNFQVNIDPERIPKRDPSVVLRAKDGLWLKMKPL